MSYKVVQELNKQRIRLKAACGQAMTQTSTPEALFIMLNAKVVALQASMNALIACMNRNKRVTENEYLAEQVSALIGEIALMEQGLGVAIDDAGRVTRDRNIKVFSPGAAGLNF